MACDNYKQAAPTELKAKIECPNILLVIPFHFTFSYSFLAAIKMGISASASFHSVKKS